MEFTKTLYEVRQDLKKAGEAIFRKARTGEDVARMFYNLDQRDENIHELVDRIQSATGNDRYYTMMSMMQREGVDVPYSFSRPPIKNDSPYYVFNNGNLRKEQQVRRKGRGL